MALPTLRAALIALALAVCGSGAAQKAPRIYNTAKQKLDRGESVVGGTVTSSDGKVGIRLLVDRDAAQSADL